MPLLLQLLLTAIALTAQDRVNPALTIQDIHGQAQRPFEAKGKPALVFFIVPDCPISNRYARTIKQICDNEACTLVYVDPDLTPDKVKKHMTDFGHGSYPAIIDATQSLAKAAGATVTPEVAVILPNGTIAYRGRIDNTWASFGQNRRQPTETDLKNALDEIAAVKPVTTPRTKAIGCFITPIELLKH